MKKAIYIATVTNLFSQETLESTIYSSVCNFWIREKEMNVLSIYKDILKS